MAKIYTVDRRGVRSYVTWERDKAAATRLVQWFRNAGLAIPGVVYVVEEE